MLLLFQDTRNTIEVMDLLTHINKARSALTPYPVWAGPPAVCSDSCGRAHAHRHGGSTNHAYWPHIV